MRLGVRVMACCCCCVVVVVVLLLLLAIAAAKDLYVAILATGSVTLFNLATSVADFSHTFTIDNCHHHNDDC